MKIFSALRSSRGNHDVPVFCLDGSKNVYCKVIFHAVSREQKTGNMTAVLDGKRVALVHDWLNGMRGGEKCLEIFCELFPQADLFTLFHEKGSISSRIESMPINTSFIQNLPFNLRRRYPYYLPVFPFAMERFDLKDYDLVLSSSHCVAKGVRHDRRCCHISYIHAPMRYIWDAFDIYFGRTQTPGILRFGARLVRPILKRWDRTSSRRVDTFLCNGRNVQGKIQAFYARDAAIIHPPVDHSRFRPGTDKENYYLMVGAIVPNKRVDLAVQAFSRLGLPLKIAGCGWDEGYCRSLAAPNVEFLGYIEDSRLAELYRHARALVFPGVDDFGITPLEAQACGTPVVAHARGGALETVTERTGLFFREPTVQDLMDAVLEMEKRWETFSVEDLIENSKRFSKERFKQEIAQAVEQAYLQWLDAKRLPPD